MESSNEEAEEVRIELLVAVWRAVGVHEMLAEMRGVKLLILSELLGIGYDGVSTASCLGVDLDVPALGIGHGVSVLPDDGQEIELIERVTFVLGVLDVRAASADNDIRAVLLAFLGSIEGSAEAFEFFSTGFEKEVTIGRHDNRAETKIVDSADNQRYERMYVHVLLL